MSRGRHLAKHRKGTLGELYRVPTYMYPSGKKLLQDLYCHKMLPQLSNNFERVSSIACTLYKDQNLPAFYEFRYPWKVSLKSTASKQWSLAFRGVARFDCVIGCGDYSVLFTFLLTTCPFLLVAYRIIRTMLLEAPKHQFDMHKHCR